MLLSISKAGRPERPRNRAKEGPEAYSLSELRQLGQFSEEQGQDEDRLTFRPKTRFPDTAFDVQRVLVA